MRSGSTGSLPPLPGPHLMSYVGQASQPRTPSVILLRMKATPKALLTFACGESVGKAMVRDRLQ